MLDDFKYYCQALGINMLWNGYAVVIFVRDGLKIGPQGSIMMALFWILGLLLLFPINIFQRIYSVNKTLLFLWGSFAAISVVYMVYYPSMGYNFRGDLLREVTTYCFPVAFLFGMLYYPDDKQDILLKVTAIFALIGSLGLIYSILNDPNWNIGKRAAIGFSSFGAGHEGNPHTFASNAVRCLLASAICAYQCKKLLIKFFYVSCVLLSISVLFLTRTNSSIFAVGLAFGFFALFHGKKIVPAVLSYKSFVIFGTFLSISVLFSAKYSALINIYRNTWTVIYKRILNTIYTAFDINLGNEEVAAAIDYSSVNRVISLNYFRDIFLEQDIEVIFFGEGYKSIFLDVPILEAFISQGIFGFIFYGGFAFLLALYVIQEILQPTTPWRTFLAYVSFMTILGIISGGRPIDAGNWMIYVVFIRFLGAKYISKLDLRISNTYQNQL